MWSNLQETADLVTFTEEILNRKFHFLSSVLNLKACLFTSKLILENNLLRDDHEMYISVHAAKGSYLLMNII